MTILLATGIYPPESGGPATYTRAFARALVRAGHVVRVITYGEMSISEDDFEVIRISRRGGIFVRYVRYAWSVYRMSKDADVLYAQGAVSEGVPVALVAKLLGKKMVLRVPGDYAWEMGMQMASKDTESSLDRFLMRAHAGRIGMYERLERWVARSAWSVIAPSAYLASVVRRWGVPTERIQVIKNAVPALPSTESRSVLRVRFGVEDKVVCFAPGRAVPWKGIDDLISWWYRVPTSHLLVYAGDGPEFVAWKKLAEREGVADRVRFLGRLSQQEMAEWYAAADVFVLHAGYEGYPHAVPEAVSKGLLCLVSDRGGNPETREEFGEQVKVLPYQDRDAWVAELSKVSIQSEVSRAPSPVSWTHEEMTVAVVDHLSQAAHPDVGKKGRVVMVGYERELFNTESVAFRRVASFVTPALSLSALVLGRFPEDVALELDGVHVSGSSGSDLRRSWRAIVQGVREARRLPGRTVITAQDPFIAGLIGYAISRWTNQPLEIQEHADFWSGEWERERWMHRVWSLIGRVLLGRAERVRVVSERVKAHLIKKGIPASKIEVIPVAQDLSALFVRPLSSPTRAFTFVVPCRFVAQKGLDLFLEAFERLRKQGADVRALVIGSGPLESWLRHEVEVRGLHEALDIRGWMPSEELWEEADALVVASRYEGWGRTIVEAMAAGVPVITTEVGCVGSFFRSGLDGSSVPVGDPDALAAAMKQCVEEVEGRQKRVVQARERAQAFPDQAALHDRQRLGWETMFAEAYRRPLGPRFELWVIGFVVFAVLIRALSVLLFHGQLVNREWGFYILVERWFQGYGYSFARELGCASAYRSPGFLFFLTALYFVFDPANTWAQAIVQNGIVVVALWLTYVVGKRLVGARAALVGAFLMAVYPYTFYHYTQYYHTFLQATGLLLVLWLVFRFEETRKYRWAIAAGLAIGGLAYVQGTILVATPFLAGWILWRFWPDWKRAVVGVGLMAICSAGLIAPWTYRNWKIFHAFVPLTTDVGLALFKANNENIGLLTARGYPQETVGEVVVSSTNPFYFQYRLPMDLEAKWSKEGVLHPSIFWTEWHPREPTGRVDHCVQLGPLNEYEYNRYWQEKANTWIAERWRTEGWKLQVQKVSTFWRPGLFPSVKTGAPWSFAGSVWKEWVARVGVLLSTAVVIIGGWLGMILAIRSRDRYVLVPLALCLVYTFLHSWLAGYTKYRIPLDHLLAGYAGSCLVILWDKLRQRS